MQTEKLKKSLHLHHLFLSGVPEISWQAQKFTLQKEKSVLENVAENAASSA